MSSLNFICNNVNCKPVMFGNFSFKIILCACRLTVVHWTQYFYLLKTVRFCDTAKHPHILTYFPPLQLLLFCLGHLLHLLKPPLECLVHFISFIWLSLTQLQHFLYFGDKAVATLKHQYAWYLHPTLF